MGQRVALRGENPIFGPLSKNNTGRAGLPVKSYTTTGFEHTTCHKAGAPCNAHW